MSNRPVVVCLCGSSRFMEEFQAANKRETLAGKIVLSMGMFGHREPGFDMDGPTKTMLDELHLRKIDLADEVLVIDVEMIVCGRCGAKYLKFLRPGKRKRVRIPKCNCGSVDLNEGPYIGDSTRREIAYAESLGKRVRYLSKE